MNKLGRENLMSLEEYSEKRGQYRIEVMTHKKTRQLALGDNIRLLFEDQLTIQYQIQEMLRIERIFERAAIEEELGSYNPLIPDGQNLKATMMIEVADPEERKRQLATLIGVEKKVFLQVADYPRIYPITNEDMVRETDEKTSSVHFLRFEFSVDMINAWRSGSDIYAGIDHQAYLIAPIAMTKSISNALQQDFDANLLPH
jgi:hypothetical protein